MFHISKCVACVAPHVGQCAWKRKGRAAGRGFAFPARWVNHDGNVSRWSGFRQRSRPRSLIPQDTRSFSYSVCLSVSDLMCGIYQRKLMIYSGLHSTTLMHADAAVCVGAGLLTVGRLLKLCFWWMDHMLVLRTRLSPLLASEWWPVIT